MALLKSQLYIAVKARQYGARFYLWRILPGGKCAPYNLVNGIDSITIVMLPKPLLCPRIRQCRIYCVVTPAIEFLPVSKFFIEILIVNKLLFRIRVHSYGSWSHSHIKILISIPSKPTSKFNTEGRETNWNFGENIEKSREQGRGCRRSRKSPSVERIRESDKASSCS